MRSTQSPSPALGWHVGHSSTTAAPASAGFAIVAVPHPTLGTPVRPKHQHRTSAVRNVKGCRGITCFVRIFFTAVREVAAVNREKT